MRPALTSIAIAATAVAVVIPDTSKLGAWQDWLPSNVHDDSTRQPVDDATTALKEDLDIFASTLQDALASAGDSFASAVEDVLSAGEELVNPLISDLTDTATGGHHKHKHPTKTIYELIKENEHTTKFSALVDEHESLVKLLNSTSANHTLFVPIDEAFEHHHCGHHGKHGDDDDDDDDDEKDVAINDKDDHDDKHKHHDKPPPEVVKRILSYHIGHGLYPASRILATHTLPTELKEDMLGSHPQRLRTRVGLSGVSVNFYSRVVRPNVFATNGVIHAVNHVLIPPPFVGKEIALFPAQFSTLLLAYQKTDFVKFIHHVDMSLGSTVFAPSNSAWEKLGVAANAFLFNTDKGRGYLKALLKYHIVANSTLYSDAFYRDEAAVEGSMSKETLLQEDGEDEGGDDHRADGKGVQHSFVVLPSLLKEKPITVDIWRWGGFIDLKVNGVGHVIVQDGVAKNGVIHVVDNVPLPPREPGKDGFPAEEDEQPSGAITVEDLVERLAPYVDQDDDADEYTGETENEWSDL